MHWQRRPAGWNSNSRICTPAIGFGGGAVVPCSGQALFYGTYWSTSDGQSASDINNTCLSRGRRSVDVMNGFGEGRHVSGQRHVDPGLLKRVTVSDAPFGWKSPTTSPPAACRALINNLYIVFHSAKRLGRPGRGSLLDFSGTTTSFLCIDRHRQLRRHRQPHRRQRWLDDRLQTITHTISHELPRPLPIRCTRLDRSGDRRRNCRRGRSAGSIAFLNDYVVAGLWSVAKQTVVYPPARRAGLRSSPISVAANRPRRRGVRTRRVFQRHRDLLSRFPGSIGGE